VNKLTIILTLCQIIFSQGQLAFAEDYSECRARCDSEYTDCMNEPPATDPEVQAAKVESCIQKVQSCYPECEKLKPIENNPPEDNPNIIRK